MKSFDSGIDIYIEKAQAFAKPILNYLRTLVHEVCPECEETIKWGFPHFVYEGDILCSMASFNEHCAFGFWKEKLMLKSKELLTDKGKTAMGDFGKIKNLKDLPSKKILKICILEAMQLNKLGIKLPRTAKRIADHEITIPSDFLMALNKNSVAKKSFDAFSNSHKKEYIEYITEAKRTETRMKRIQKSIEMLKEGGSRNQKYESK